jgi:glycosyltransferase involved in cell wall biosynthesis
VSWLQEKTKNRPKLTRLFWMFRNWRECLLGTIHQFLYAVRRIPRKTVLLVEPQPWHGEILPGFAKYFTDLGYSVDVVVRYANYADNPFCRFARKPDLFVFTLWGMKRLLSSSCLQKYEYVLLTSDLMYLAEYSHWARFVYLLPEVPQGRLGGSFVEHDVQLCLKRHPEILNDIGICKRYFSQVFALTAVEAVNHKVQMLNPHYLGEVSERKELNPGKRIFVSIGRISRKTRNYDSLWGSLRELSRKCDCEVWIIGKVEERELLCDLPDCVRLLGRLSFSEMYSRLERANFLLPLLSPNVEAHRHYLHGCTSGSRQLSLGFCLPMVIQKDFADVYGFDSTNAVVYEDDADLGAAMQLAITMPPDEYADLCKSLDVMRQRVYDESLCNLKMRLEVRRC